MARMTQAQCLGCRRTVNIPAAIAKMTERYEDKLVLFCSQKCNMAFIRRVAEKARISEVREQISRIENAIDSDSGKIQSAEDSSD